MVGLVIVDILEDRRTRIKQRLLWTERLLKLLEETEMEENKVKGFVKKHKKTFIVSGIVLTGVIGGIVFKKSMSDMKADFDLDKIDLDELGLLGKVIKVEKASKAVSWFEDDSVEITDIKYTVSDLGKLGESLLEEHNDIFKPEDKISGLLVYTK